jgi:hypothetical protein
MREKPISPLRRRMIEDMSVRKFARRRNTIISATSRALPAFRAAADTLLQGPSGDRPARWYAGIVGPGTCCIFVAHGTCFTIPVKKGLCTTSVANNFFR